MPEPAPPPARPGRPPPGGRLGRLILGTDRSQQRRVTMVLMTMMLYTVCITVLVYGTLNRLFGGPAVAVLAGLCAVTGLTFYTLVRSGLNLRFAEPALTFPQGLVAMTLIAFSYAISGPAHSSALILLPMVMFFVMFDMGVNKVRLLMLYSIALMGATMYWCSQVDPQAYSPKLELINFAWVATVLPAISSLAVQLANMRLRLQTQKAELEKAMARLQDIATHDEMTGLVNRRHMIDVLGDHVKRRARGGPGFAVAIADIDHFKKVNDTYGHRVGDEALCSFARQAAVQLRNTDIIARWGGEEFLLLLPETPRGDPNIGIERLRASLANTVASADVPALRVAFSTGLAVYLDGETIEDTIERADRALYEAKQSGRSRTCRL